MDFFINIILSGGKTVHNRLKVPIHLNEDTLLSAAMNETTSLHLLLKETVLMIIDEVTMANKWLIKAIDRSLRDVRKCDKPKGGITSIWSGRVHKFR